MNDYECLPPRGSKVERSLSRPVLPERIARLDELPYSQGRIAALCSTRGNISIVAKEDQMENKLKEKL